MKTKEEITKVMVNSQRSIDNLIKLLEYERGDDFDFEKFKRISDDIISLNASVIMLRWVLE